MAYKAYYRLTKPGIVYGNAITAAAGFLLASKNSFNFWLFLVVIAGSSLIIASACVFNNFLDRGLDAKMERTKKRALVTGEISIKAALAYATTLGAIGFVLLAVFTNWLTVGVAALAGFFYIVLYGIAKRRSVHGVIVGSVPGAAPPVIGYCAVTGHLDGAALILFLILVFWQMPHFYSIAIYRYKDYKAAKVPVLPIKWGFLATKIQIVAYIVAFIGAIAALKAFGYAGWAYLIVSGAVGLVWLWRGIQGFRATNDVAWARQLFFFSLIVNLTFSIMIGANNWLVKL